MNVRFDLIMKLRGDEEPARAMRHKLLSHFQILLLWLTELSGSGYYSEQQMGIARQH